MKLASWLIALALAVAGCVRPGAFHCTSNADCVLSGAAGTCELVGFCSFPDLQCAGGSRFGQQSGAYAGQCVELGDGGTSDATPALITIGGSVSGLTGTGLVLRDNGGDDLPIAASGPFTFAMPVLTGDPYAVTVSSQPSSPAQMCSVSGGSGAAGFMNITTVGVTCSTSAYHVGGTVVGLSTSGLVLTDNGGDDKPISANGPFTFATPIASGATYAVGIKTQPSGTVCVLSGATGTVGSGDVSSVVVNCTPNTYTIGGTTTGLEGTVVLRNNGGSDLMITSNGSFAFPTPQGTGTAYAVTVQTQPGYPPRSQTCVVGNGSGSVASANVTSVTITCTTNTFTIGGSVTGLSGTLVLKDNGTDTLSVTASGMFTFATRIASGGTYSVAIGTQPMGQTCAITANPTGTVTSSNITNVAVACSATGTDPGILCGAAHCDPASQSCCVTNGVPACASSCSGPGTIKFLCDDHQDCATAGTPLLVCCGTITAGASNGTYCGKASLCTSPHAYYCDPNIANPCPDGGTCTATTAPSGYYRCF